MSDFSPVAWTEGMFLRPQHMQQQERYLQFQHSKIRDRINPLAWGVYSFELDHQLLSLGQFGLNNIECIFQDNTLAILPEQSSLPHPITIPSGTINQLVYIVLPMNKSTGLNISDVSDNQITRYCYNDHNIIDTSVGSDAMEVLQIGKLDCKLKLQNEDRAGYVSIAIAKIIDVSDEGIIKLDNKFIPTCFALENIKGLTNLIKETQGMIQHRAETIAARLTQSQGVSSSISDFLMLQLLNRYQPKFEHLGSVLGVHPERLYSNFISLSGELATFSSQSKRPPKFPKYQHENLTRIFSEVMLDMNQSLSSVLEQTAVELPLEKSKYGIHFTPLHDKGSLDTADFIIAVSAALPGNELKKRLPAQIKIGSVETIRELVNSQLPGIGIIELAAAPRQVPYHSGYHYFQLDKTNKNWFKLKESGGIAMHLSGHYPELKIELWVVNG